MCVKNDGNETRSTATIRVDIPPSKITKLHELEKESVSNEKYTTRRDCLTKKPENIEFIKIVKVELKISNTENHYQVMIEILKNVDAIPEGETQVGILTTPTKTLFEFLQLISFPIDNDNYDKDDDNKMDLDEYQSL